MRLEGLNPALQGRGFQPTIDSFWQFAASSSVAANGDVPGKSVSDMLAFATESVADFKAARIQALRVEVEALTQPSLLTVALLDFI